MFILLWWFLTYIYSHILTNMLHTQLHKHTKKQIENHQFVFARFTTCYKINELINRLTCANRQALMVQIYHSRSYSLTLYIYIGKKKTKYMYNNYNNNISHVIPRIFRLKYFRVTNQPQMFAHKNTIEW